MNFVAGVSASGGPGKTTISIAANLRVVPSRHTRQESFLWH